MPDSFLDSLIPTGPSGGSINTPGDATNPFDNPVNDAGVPIGAGGPSPTANPDSATGEEVAGILGYGRIEMLGDGVMRVYGKNGPQGGPSNRTRITTEQWESMISGAVSDGRISQNDADMLSEHSAGLRHDFDTGQPPGTSARTSGVGAGGAQTTSQAEAARAAAASPNGGAGVGRGRGGGGGAAAGRNQGAGGGTQSTTTTTQPNVPFSGGAGGASVDPNAPLGIPGISPNVSPGSDFFGQDGGALPNMGNPYEGLDENSNLNDIIAAIAGGQLGAQNAAMDILGGVFNESLNSAESRQQRGRVNDLLSNPFSFSEGRIQRLQGIQNEAIGQRADRLATGAEARQASAGVRPDSGVAQREQDVIASNAAQQASQSERAVRERAAVQNQQDLRSAIGVAGGAIQQDQGARRQIADTAATGVLGTTRVAGDFALTNALLGANSGSQQNRTNDDFRDSREGVGNFPTGQN